MSFCTAARTHTHSLSSFSFPFGMISMQDEFLAGHRCPCHTAHIDLVNWPIDGRPENYKIPIFGGRTQNVILSYPTSGFPASPCPSDTNGRWCNFFVNDTMPIEIEMSVGSSSNLVSASSCTRNLLKLKHTLMILDFFMCASIFILFWRSLPASRYDEMDFVFAVSDFLLRLCVCVCVREPFP